MKYYFKEIDGEIVIKPLNKIRLIIGDAQIFCPSEDILFEQGWEEYSFDTVESVEPELSESEELEVLRTETIDRIVRYDSSDSVNCFYLKGQPMWFDKATRLSLKMRFETELDNGLEDTTLWYNDESYRLKIVDAIKMLSAIELYASQCYDNTQRHLSRVRKTDNLVLLKDYDCSSGYPHKLRFQE